MEILKRFIIHVIKGKDTKVVSYRANEAFDKTVITTVHKAKVISFVKKNKMSYKVIRDIAVKLVKGKKSKNEFVYKWNKSKPMVIYYTYNTSW